MEYYHGKEELSSLDDELPIVIFIVFKTSNVNLPADLQLIENYISYESEHDYEQRLLINIRVSIQFICNEFEDELKKHQVSEAGTNQSNSSPPQS